MSLPSVFDFPDTVDERSARLVAAGVVALSLGVVVGGQRWLIVPLALGFLLRVASGPRFSPLALLVTRQITPRLPGPERLTAGAPKRFAQGIGATLSTTALLGEFVFGSSVLATVLVSMIIAAASAESFLGYCLGCRVYAVLIRWGIASEADCEDCADISRRAIIA